jgi:DNA-directed RNA polymerase subunit RPC12/RpoP
MRSRFGEVGDLYNIAAGFKCIQCSQPVSSNPLLSGVNNRNHCPYCLWSRHMDLHTAGDRLAACKAPMEPVGVTVKRIRKKYDQGRSGELMLVHLCVECGKLSINRTAADDDAGLMLEIFEVSLQSGHELLDRMESSGIELLGVEDAELIHARLLGWSDYVYCEKTFA